MAESCFTGNFFSTGMQGRDSPRQLKQVSSTTEHVFLKCNLIESFVQFARASRHVCTQPLFVWSFVWANLILRFNPQRSSLVSPPGGSGIPHSNNRRSLGPPHNKVLVQTHHLAAAVDRVRAKTDTPRAFGRLLASPTTGYWSNPPRRGGLPSGQR